MDNLLKKIDVCCILRISQPTLDRMIAARQIPVYKIGGQIRFRESDIEAYISRCLIPAAPAKQEPAERRPRTQRSAAANVVTYYPGMKVV